MKKNSAKKDSMPIYEGFFPVAVIALCTISLTSVMIGLITSEFRITDYLSAIGEVGTVIILVLVILSVSVLITTITGMLRHRKKDDRDKFHAKASCFLSLGFFVPLFNIPLCFAALVLALMALKKNIKEPERYGGRAYAIAGLVLSLSGIVLTFIGLVIYLLSSRICGSAVCTAYFQSTP